MGTVTVGLCHVYGDYADHTVFFCLSQDINIEAVIRKLDFTEFDDHFALRPSRQLGGFRVNGSSAGLPLIGDTGAYHSKQEEICFVEPKRAQNLCE